jgi:hypothetical protein
MIVLQLIAIPILTLSADPKYVLSIHDKLKPKRSNIGSQAIATGVMLVS